MGLHLVLSAWFLSVALVASSPASSVPISTQDIITTVTVAAITSYSEATLATLILTSKTLNEIETITTKVDGTKTTEKTNLGPTATTVRTITSAFLTSYAQVSSYTIISTIGESTIFGPDPTTSVTSSSNAVSSLQPFFSASNSTLSPVGTTSVSATTTSASAALSSNQASSSSDGLSTGAKIGITIGCTAVVAIAVLIAFYMGQRRLQRRQYENMEKNSALDGDIDMSSVIANSITRPSESHMYYSSMSHTWQPSTLSTRRQSEVDQPSDAAMAAALGFAMRPAPRPFVTPQEVPIGSSRVELPAEPVERLREEKKGD